MTIGKGVISGAPDHVYVVASCGFATESDWSAARPALVRCRG
jgi:hypothetical protein